MDAPPARGRDGDAPRTFGELRKQLAEMGNPWQPDPSRADEEPIPEFPTGGELGGETPGELVPEDGVAEFLKDTPPPSNPQMRKLWREEGLLDGDNDDSRRDG